MREENRIAFHICVGLLGLAFIALRLYIRYWMNRGIKKTRIFFLADVLVVGAFLCATGFSAADIWAQKKKISVRGKMLTMSPEEMMDYGIAMRKYPFANFFLYMAALWGVKGAFLCIYFSAAEVLTRRVYYSLWAVTVFTVANILLAYGFTLFSCLPVSRNWSLGPDNCLNRWSMEYSIMSAVTHILTDFTTFGMGILVVRATQKMGRRERLGIAFIFGLGLLTIGSAAIRFAVQTKMIVATKAGKLILEADFEEVDVWMTLSSVLEMNLALVAISIPALRVWIRKSKSKNGSNGSTGQWTSDTSGSHQLSEVKGALPGLTTSERRLFFSSGDDASYVSLPDPEAGTDDGKESQGQTHKRGESAANRKEEGSQR